MYRNEVDIHAHRRARMISLRHAPSGMKILLHYKQDITTIFSNTRITCFTAFLTSFTFLFVHLFFCIQFTVTGTLSWGRILWTDRSGA